MMAFNNSYVFVSYAHRDGNAVLPCVYAMKNSGINIWYDDGIEAGSEWPEYIAEKVLSCTKFVLFVSNAYMESQNCKRELNFAISHKKDILSVFIEDTILTPGMEMQLGTYQAIYRNRFANDALFYNSLSRERYFDECRRPGTTTVKTNDGSQFVRRTNNGVNINGSYSVHTGIDNSGGRINNTGGRINNTGGRINNTGGETVIKHGQKNSLDELFTRLKSSEKSPVVAAVLAIVLGSFGVHRFYLNQILWGVLYLVFCWTYIPFILGVIEGIMILVGDTAKFEKRYKCKAKINKRAE